MPFSKHLSIVAAARNYFVVAVAFAATLPLVRTAQAQATPIWGEYQQSAKGAGQGIAPAVTDSVVVSNYIPDYGVSGQYVEAVISADGTLYVLDAGSELQAYQNTYGTSDLFWRLKPKWTSKMVFTGQGFPGPYFSTPAIGPDGTVYSWEGNRLYAVKDNGTTGSQKWTFQVAGDGYESPVVGTDGTIYCVNNNVITALQDSGTSATIKWTYSVPSGTYLITPAIGSDGTIYALGSGQVFALTDNGTSGSLKWQYAIPGAAPETLSGGISISPGGTLYVAGSGSDTSNNTYPGILLSLTDSGASPTQNWLFSGTEQFSAAPAISPNGTLYAMFSGNGASGFCSFTDSGSSVSLNWTDSTGLAGPPVVASDGTIYIASSSSPGGLYSLTDHGGSYSINWTSPYTPTSALSLGPNGFVYFGTNYGPNEEIELLGVGGSIINSVGLSTYNIVSGGQNATGTVTLTQPAGYGGLTVALRSSSPDAQVPNSVFLPQGSSSVNFLLTGSGVASYEYVTITASYAGGSTTAPITLIPAYLNSFKVLPTAVVTGGKTVQAEVTLFGKAPTGGTAVSLSSDDPNVSVPASVTVAAGTTYDYFNVTTYAVFAPETATLTATAGEQTMKISVVLNPASPSSFVLTNSTVTGGQSTMGEVKLGGKAGPSGQTVSLTSTSSDVQVPATVTVPSGATYAYFNITTTTVSVSENVAITANFGNSLYLEQVLTVNSAILSNFKLSATTLSSGSSLQGEVVLNSKAAFGGDVVSLSSSSADIQVPATVKVPSGSTYLYFNITSSVVAAPETVTLTASYGGATINLNVALNPPALTLLKTTATSVQGGKSTYGEVAIGRSAPTGGMVVNLSSGSSLAQVPSTVTIPAGSTYVVFTVNTTSVAANTTVVLTASNGTSSQQATLTLTP